MQALQNTASKTIVYTENRLLVNYESTAVAELEAEFKAAEFFNIRTGSELHRAAVFAAQDDSLNAFVCQAIKEKIKSTGNHI